MKTAGPHTPFIGQSPEKRLLRNFGRSMQASALTIENVGDGASQLGVILDIPFLSPEVGGWFNAFGELATQVGMAMDCSSGFLGAAWQACHDDFIGIISDGLAGRTLKAGGLTKWEADLVVQGTKSALKFFK